MCSGCFFWDEDASNVCDEHEGDEVMWREKYFLCKENVKNMKKMK
jgi:hypothetical protein